MQVRGRALDLAYTNPWVPLQHLTKAKTSYMEQNPPLLPCVELRLVWMLALQTCTTQSDPPFEYICRIHVKCESACCLLGAHAFPTMILYMWSVFRMFVSCSQKDICPSHPFRVGYEERVNLVPVASCLVVSDACGDPYLPVDECRHYFNSLLCHFHMRIAIYINNQVWQHLPRLSHSVIKWPYVPENTGTMRL